MPFFTEQQLRNFNDRINRASSVGSSSTEYTELLTAFRAMTAAGEVAQGEEAAQWENLRRKAAAYYNAKLPEEQNETRRNRMDIARDLYTIANSHVAAAEQAVPDAPAQANAEQKQKENEEKLRKFLFGNSMPDDKFDEDIMTYMRSRREAGTGTLSQEKQQQEAENRRYVAQCIDQSIEPEYSRLQTADPKTESAYQMYSIYHDAMAEIDEHQKERKLLEAILDKVSKKLAQQKDPGSRDTAAFCNEAKSRLSETDVRTDYPAETFSTAGSFAIETEREGLGRLNNWISDEKSRNPENPYTFSVRDIADKDIPRDALIESIKKFIPDFNPDRQLGKQIDLRAFILNRSESIRADVSKKVEQGYKAADSFNRVRQDLRKDLKKAFAYKSDYRKLLNDLRDRLKKVDTSKFRNKKFAEEKIAELDKNLMKLGRPFALENSAGHDRVIDTELLHRIQQSAAALTYNDTVGTIFWELGALKEPYDEGIHSAARMSAKNYLEYLNRLQERFNDATSTFSKDSREFTAMKEDLRKLKDIVSGETMLGAPTRYGINIDSPEFNAQLNRLKDSATTYFEAKLAQDKNANRYERLRIAEEIMGMGGVVEHYSKTFESPQRDEYTRITTKDVQKTILRMSLVDFSKPEEVQEKFLQKDYVNRVLTSSTRVAQIERNYAQYEPAFKGAAVVYDLMKKEQEGWAVLRDPDHHSRAERALAKRDVILGQGIRNLLSQKLVKPKNEEDMAVMAKNNAVYSSIAENVKKIEKLKFDLLQRKAVAQSEKSIKANTADMAKQNFSAAPKLK